jgi:hypothetical protein
MSFVTSQSLRSLRASTSRLSLGSLSSVRGLATPAEVQAGTAPSKPQNYKDFKIYRWVSEDDSYGHLLSHLLSYWIVSLLTFFLFFVEPR